MYCPFLMLLKYPNTNEEYSIRSIVNVIRHRIKNTEFTYKQVAEQIYLHNFPNTNTICEVCDNRKIYMCFSKGYECKDRSCSLTRTVMGMHAHRGQNVDEYVKFIKENIEYYRKHCHDKNVINPYTNKSTRNQTLIASVSNTLASQKNLLFYKDICPYCSNEYDEHYMKRTKGYCGSRSCRSIKRRYSLNNVIYVTENVTTFLDGVRECNVSKIDLFEFVRGFDFKSIDKKLFLKKFDDVSKQYDIVTVENAKILYRYKHDMGKIQFVEYDNVCFLSISKVEKPHFKQYFRLDTDDIKSEYFDNPEYFSPCVICNKTNQHKQHFSNTLLSRFCSVECYRISLRDTETYHPALFQTEDRRKTHSELIKKRILDGKFTPCVTNSWCKSRIYVNLPNDRIYPCRSSWEAVFAIANPHLEYEKIRIPYYKEDVLAIYIVDFVDELGKVLYEIKPKGQQEGDVYELKMSATRDWCKLNGYTLEIIDEVWYNNYFRTDRWEPEITSQPQGNLILQRMKQFLNGSK